MRELPRRIYYDSILSDSCPPRDLYLVVGLDISSSYLIVFSMDLVSVSKVPGSLALGLVVVEVALEVSAVGVLPFALDHLSVLEGAHVLHARLVEHVSSLTIFLAVFPGARVDVLVRIDEDPLAVSLSVEPVSVVLANALVSLFSDSTLVIVLPFSSVGVFDIFFALATSGGSNGVCALSVAEASLETSVIDVSIWIGSYSRTCVVMR